MILTCFRKPTKDWSVRFIPQHPHESGSNELPPTPKSDEKQNNNTPTE